MLDTVQWTTGKQFSVLEVGPPLAGRPFVRYQVVLVPRDEHEPPVWLWCETTTPGAAPLQVQDVVAVQGRTLSSVLVERLVQGEPDGSQHLLVIPSYDTDFDAWAQQQAEALRAQAWEQLDVEHLAEEVEALRNTERRGVHSQLRLILSHLLKWRYEPDKRTESWRSTIANGRVLVQEALEDLPTLARELPALATSAYPRARRDAAKETGLALATFPEACPWPVDQVLDEDFWPEPGWSQP